MNNKTTLVIILLSCTTLLSAADKAAGKETAGLFMSIAMLALFALASVLLYVLLGFVKKNRETQRLLKESAEKITALEASIQTYTIEKEELTKKITDQQRVIEKDDKMIAGLRETLKSDSFDGRFPICAKCKDIRDERGFWHPIEEYLQNRVGDKGAR
jgi:competence protein ComGC